MAYLSDNNNKVAHTSSSMCYALYVTCPCFYVCCKGTNIIIFYRVFTESNAATIVFLYYSVYIPLAIKLNVA